MTGTKAPGTGWTSDTSGWARSIVSNMTSPSPKKWPSREQCLGPTHSTSARRARAVDPRGCVLDGAARDPDGSWLTDVASWIVHAEPIGSEGEDEGTLVLHHRVVKEQRAGDALHPLHATRVSKCCQRAQPRTAVEPTEGARRVIAYAPHSREPRAAPAPPPSAAALPDPRTGDNFPDIPCTSTINVGRASIVRRSKCLRRFSASPTPAASRETGRQGRWASQVRGRVREGPIPLALHAAARANPQYPLERLRLL